MVTDFYEAEAAAPAEAETDQRVSLSPQQFPSEMKVLSSSKTNSLILLGMAAHAKHWTNTECQTWSRHRWREELWMRCREKKKKSYNWQILRKYAVTQQSYGFGCFSVCAPSTSTVGALHVGLFCGLWSVPPQRACAHFLHWCYSERLCLLTVSVR